MYLKYALSFTICGIKYLPWYVILIEVYVSFDRGQIINQPWHFKIKLISLVIMRRCKWGHVLEICVSFYSGESKYLPWHVIPIVVFVNFYRGQLINQPWDFLKLTSLVIMKRCKWGHIF